MRYKRRQWLEGKVHRSAGDGYFALACLYADGCLAAALALSELFEVNLDPTIIRETGNDLRKQNVPHALLRPFKIFPHFLGSLHAVGEVRSGASQPSLSKRLELCKFSLFGVELAGSVKISNLPAPDGF